MPLHCLTLMVNFKNLGKQFIAENKPLQGMALPQALTCQLLEAERGPLEGPLLAPLKSPSSSLEVLQCN